MELNLLFPEKWISSTHLCWPLVCATKRWMYHKQKHAVAPSISDSGWQLAHQSLPAHDSMLTPSAPSLPLLTRLKPLPQLVLWHDPHSLSQHSCTLCYFCSDHSTNKRGNDREGLQRGSTGVDLVCRQRPLTFSLQGPVLPGTTFQLHTCRIRAGTIFLKPHCNPTRSPPLHLITSKCFPQGSYTSWYLLSILSFL